MIARKVEIPVYRKYHLKMYYISFSSIMEKQSIEDYIGRLVHIIRMWIILLIVLTVYKIFHHKLSHVMFTVTLEVYRIHDFKAHFQLCQ